MVVSWLKNKLEQKYKLSTGDLVKDLGDGFASVEDPGIVIELFPDRYQYRHPLMFFRKINIDGILVRWLDKKGTTHVYPSCCVEKMQVSDERAEQLRTTAEERFDKPKPPPQQEPLPFDPDGLFEIPSLADDDTDPAIPIPTNTTEIDQAVEEEELVKPSMNRMQEQLREVERILKERAEDDEE